MGLSKSTEIFGKVFSYLEYEIRHLVNLPLKNLQGVYSNFIFRTKIENKRLTFIIG